MTLVDTQVPPAAADASARRDAVLAALAADAGDRDRRDDGRFPDAAFARLEQAGLAAATVPPDGTTLVAYAEELRLARDVAWADLGVGRILDGHLNAVERLVVHAPADVRDAELDEVRAGRLRLGVWGADPGPGEGEPARIDGLEAGARAFGTKVFCSGAGGLHRAWVLLRGPDDDVPRRLAYLDLTSGADVDGSWWRGAGMRASASHRVAFDGARVLAVADGPGAIACQPHFARDAVRTAATWAGGLDAAVEDALATLAAKPGTGDLEALAAGRLATAAGTVTRWLEHAGALLDAPTPVDPAGVATHARDAIAREVLRALDEAAAAVGSRPFATGQVLERVTRDLRTYLLQHRLDPIVARAGRALLDARRP